MSFKWFSNFYLVARALIIALLLSVGAPLAHAEVVDGDYLIKFSDDAVVRLRQLIPELSAFSDEQILQSVSSSFGVDNQEVSEEIGVTHASGLIAPELDSAFLLELVQAEIIEFIEPDVEMQAQAVPDDTNFASQWALDDATDYDINAPEAWNIQTGSSDVVVAILDSGVQLDHPDLAGKIWTNPGEIPGNDIDDDSNGYVDDVNGWNRQNKNNDVSDTIGHGTHVAGIIGAATNNAAGVAGVAWGVKLLPLKIMNNSGVTTAGKATNMINLILKYIKAYRLGTGGANIKVVNASFGGGSNSTSFRLAIEKLNAEGVTFVAAAGNDSLDVDASPVYPASNPNENIIAVAATDINGDLASFSNYGPGTIDIAAPGANILSTAIGSGYEYRDGTSMAAPMISGIAALLYSQFPDSSAADVKQRLVSTVEDNPSLHGQVTYPGRVSAEAALGSSTNFAPVIAAIPDVEASVNQGVLNVPFSVSDPDGDAITVSAYINPGDDTLYSVSQQYGPWQPGVYYNTYGQLGKWFQNLAGDWYGLLPNKKLFKFLSYDTETGKLRKKRVATFANTSQYHAHDIYLNPALLLEAVPGPAAVPTFTLNADSIDIDVPVEADREFTVHIVADAIGGRTDRSFIVAMRGQMQPVVSELSDVVVAADPGQLSFPFTATDQDNDLLAITVYARPEGQLAHELDLELGLEIEEHGDYFNARGEYEKYIVGNDNLWYFILPNGRFYRFGGDNLIANGTLIATLSTRFYDDLTLLTDSVAPVGNAPATAVISGDSILVDIDAGFAGTFSVSLNVDDSHTSIVSEVFTVTVDNNEPVVTSLDDLSMYAHEQALVSIDATDPDGDLLSYDANALTVEQMRYNLDQKYNFQYDSVDHFNVRGWQEYYVKGFIDFNVAWFLILPNGNIHLYTSDLLAENLKLGNVGNDAYTNRNLLIDVVQPAPTVPANISVTGNQATIDPNVSEGVFVVQASVTDSVSTKTSAFSVSVGGDQPPTLYDIADQQISAATPLDLTLYGIDNNMSSVSYSASVLSYDELYVELDTRYDFTSTGDFNTRGLSEKYLKDGVGDWYMITPDGILWKFSGASANQMMFIGTQAYDNPSLLEDATVVDPVTAPPVNLNVTGDSLTLDPQGYIDSPVLVEVVMSDGTSQDTTTFLVEIENSDPSISQIAPEIVEYEGSLNINLSATDPDNQSLQYSAQVLQDGGVEYYLDQLYDFYLDAGSVYYNAWGFEEKWLRSTDGTWYYILAGGELYRLEDTGNFSLNPLIATLADSAYADPAAALVNVIAPLSSGSGIASVSGNTLTYDAEQGYVGQVTLLVEVTDGKSTSFTFVTLDVGANYLPEFSAVGDVVVPNGTASVQVVLSATDSDSGTLTYGASAADESYQAYLLDQQYNFYLPSEYNSDQAAYFQYFFDTRGMAEQYFYGTSGSELVWFAVSPQGYVYSLLASNSYQMVLEAKVPESFYSDLNNFVDIPLPSGGSPNATVSVDGNTVTIDLAPTYIGNLPIVATVNDGQDTVSQVFTVTVTNDPAVVGEIDDALILNDEVLSNVAITATNSEAWQTLTYSGHAYDVLEFRKYVDSLYDLRVPNVFNDVQNTRGWNEKYYRGKGGDWFAILPSGELLRWLGTDSDFVKIGNVGSDVWTDRSLLVDVAAAAVPSADVAVAMTGNSLSATPLPAFVGTVVIVAEVDDGSDVSFTSFLLEVEDAGAAESSSVGGGTAFSGNDENSHGSSEQKSSNASSGESAESDQVNSDNGSSSDSSSSGSSPQAPSTSTGSSASEEQSEDVASPDEGSSEGSSNSVGDDFELVFGAELESSVERISTHEYAGLIAESSELELRNDTAGLDSEIVIDFYDVDGELLAQSSGVLEAGGLLTLKLADYPELSANLEGGSFIVGSEYEVRVVHSSATSEQSSEISAANSEDKVLPIVATEEEGRSVLIVTNIKSSEQTILVQFYGADGEITAEHELTAGAHETVQVSSPEGSTAVHIGSLNDDVRIVAYMERRSPDGTQTSTPALSEGSVSLEAMLFDARRRTTSVTVVNTCAYEINVRAVVKRIGKAKKKRTNRKQRMKKSFTLAPFGSKTLSTKDMRKLRRGLKSARLKTDTACLAGVGEVSLMTSSNRKSLAMRYQYTLQEELDGQALVALWRARAQRLAQIEQD